MRSTLFLLLASYVLIAASESGLEEGPISYGVDISWPIHRTNVSSNYPWLPHNLDPNNTPTPLQYQNMSLAVLGDRQSMYNKYMKGCNDHYPGRGPVCSYTESDRIAMNSRQPASMQNYTDTGFKKIKCPSKVFSLIKEFWDKNQMKRKKEEWFAGSIYTNHWESPTHMVSVDDASLRGGGIQLKQAIWDAARETLEQWTGQELTECSLYGIRIYEEGAILAPHCDRLPLVSSGIINVAQDVDEPW